MKPIITHLIVVLAWAITLPAQTIQELELDPTRAISLPISRDITTVMFPGPLTAVAGADMVIDTGKTGAEIEDGAPVRFHVTHATGANFILLRSLQADAAGRLTAIYEGAAYVLQLQAVPQDSVASLIFKRPGARLAMPVDRPPEPVRFTPRIGLSLLDRARAYPVLANSLPKAVEGVTRHVANRTVELRDIAVTVEEVLRFSKEDAVVFLLKLRNTTDNVVELAPSTFAARVGPERFEQAIANGPRRLAPRETADAEFAVVGLPDGTRNDLSADNAFTILINTARRGTEVSIQTNVQPEGSRP